MQYGKLNKRIVVTYEYLKIALKTPYDFRYELKNVYYVFTDFVTLTPVINPSGEAYTYSAQGSPNGLNFGASSGIFSGYLADNTQKILRVTVTGTRTLLFEESLNIECNYLFYK